MADVSAQKQNLQVEDLRTGGAASESTMQKVGGSVNFWNRFFEGTRAWVANGPYSIIPAPDNGIDGAFFCWSNQEIWAVGFHNHEAGSAGDTEMDILKLPVGGGPGVSIFSQRPIIPSSAGNDARIIVQILPTYQVLFVSPGCTAPTLAGSSLDAGDSLIANFVGKQIGGKGATIALAIRPR